MSDLKPCPFCGSSDWSKTTTAGNWPIVKCNECGAQGPCVHVDPKEAIAAWNHRPEPAGPQGATDQPKGGDANARDKRAEHDQAMREESLTYIGPPAPASGLVDQSCFCPNCEQQAAEIRRLTASYNWLMDRYQALGAESRERIEQAEAYRDEYLAIAESRIAQINEANARAEQLERERDEAHTEILEARTQIGYDNRTIANANATIAASEARCKALEAENSALAADQCHAGYAGDNGDHRCRGVDEAIKRGWKAAHDCIAYCVANWQQDARTEKQQASLAVISEYLADMRRESPDEYLAIKWRGVEALAATEKSRDELISENAGLVSDRAYLAETLDYIAPALLVLRNMCRTAGLEAGAAKAQEMIDNLRSLFHPVATRNESELQTALAASEARVKVLEEALEPFAKAAGQLNWDETCLVEIPLGDLRRARAALKREGE